MHFCKLQLLYCQRCVYNRLSHNLVYFLSGPAFLSFGQAPQFQSKVIALVFNIAWLIINLGGWYWYEELEKNKNRYWYTVCANIPHFFFSDSSNVVFTHLWQRIVLESGYYLTIKINFNLQYKAKSINIGTHWTTSTLKLREIIFANQYNNRALVPNLSVLCL